MNTVLGHVRYNFIYSVNIDVLLNAILKNFSRALEQGSTLKFIMYSTVSTSFGRIHTFVIYCINGCFTSSCPIFLLWCLFSHFSMTLHSTASRQLWMCTTAFFLLTLPVNSLSSTRSMMGNDILSTSLHALHSLHI